MFSWIAGLFSYTRTPGPAPFDERPICSKCSSSRMNRTSREVLSSAVRTEKTTTRNIHRDNEGRQTGKSETITTRSIKRSNVKEFWKCPKCEHRGYTLDTIEEDC